MYDSSRLNSRRKARESQYFYKVYIYNRKRLSVHNLIYIYICTCNRTQYFLDIVLRKIFLKLFLSIVLHIFKNQKI